MKYLPYFSILIVMYTSSCITIKFPASTKFDKLDSVSKSKVIFNDDQCCDKKNQDLVYAVNATQVKKCLSQHPKSIVYLWAPHCHGDHCLPLSVFVNTCTQKGYHPIIMAEYIDMASIESMNNTAYPVFAFDHRYYKQQKLSKCIDPFLLELTGQKKNKQNYGARYLVFEKDQFKEFKVDMNTVAN